MQITPSNVCIKHTYHDSYSSISRKLIHEIHVIFDTWRRWHKNAKTNSHIWKSQRNAQVKNLIIHLRRIRSNIPLRCQMEYSNELSSNNFRIYNTNTSHFSCFCWQSNSFSTHAKRCNGTRRADSWRSLTCVDSSTSCVDGSITLEEPRWHPQYPSVSTEGNCGWLISITIDSTRVHVKQPRTPAIFQKV